MCSRVAFLLFCFSAKTFSRRSLSIFFLCASKRRNASKCNFLAKRPFHCFHSCFYLCCASSQDIEPFLLLSFAHFLFLSVFLSFSLSLSLFLSFCLLPLLQLKSESTFSFGSHVRDVCLIGSKQISLLFLENCQIKTKNKNQQRQLFKK